jgi:small subunit ribosomal protein S6
VRKYDLTVILNPNLEPERLSQEEKAAEQIITAYAEVLDIQRVGQRALAFPINKIGQGYYLYFALNSEPQKLPALLAELRLRDNVLRVMTTRETALA